MGRVKGYTSWSEELLTEVKKEMFERFNSKFLA